MAKNINSVNRFVQASDLIRSALDVDITSTVTTEHDSNVSINGIEFYYKVTGCIHTFYTIKDVKAFIKAV